MKPKFLFLLNSENHMRLTELYGKIREMEKLGGSEFYGWVTSRSIKFIGLRGKMCMIIETDRLYLIPLTVPQLRLWVENIPFLEKELNCRYCAEPMKGVFLDIVKGQLDITEKTLPIICIIHFGF